MVIKHAKTAIPDVDKVDCNDWNANHTVDNQHIIPVGSLFMYGAAAAPTGWLLCNGAAVSRSTYAALFAVIGTTYGVGDGSTTFNVPDFASKFVRGVTAGATGGSDDAVVVAHDHGGATGNQSASHSHTFTGDALPDHSHTENGGGPPGAFCGVNRQVGAPIATSSVSAGTPSGTIGDQSADHNHTINSDGVAAANQNIPAYLGANFIIKY